MVLNRSWSHPQELHDRAADLAESQVSHDECAEHGEGAAPDTAAVDATASHPGTLTRPIRVAH